MLPDQYTEVDGEFAVSAPPGGTAYRVMNNGKFRRLWSIKGWYAYPGDLFLSADGKTLIRLHEEFLLQENGQNFGAHDPHVLVSIYRNGKLIKKYGAKDLIADLKAGIRLSGWGYKWIARDATSPGIATSFLHSVEEKKDGQAAVVYYPDIFRLETLERKLFIFDLKTGDILHKVPAENAGK